jgi:hypothetical protein
MATMTNKIVSIHAVVHLPDIDEPVVWIAELLKQAQTNGLILDFGDFDDDIFPNVYFKYCVDLETFGSTMSEATWSHAEHYTNTLIPSHITNVTAFEIR